MVKKMLFISLTLSALMFSWMVSECFADVPAQLEQAETYENDGYYQQAEGIYETILTDYPDTNDAFQAQKRLAVLYVSWDKQPQAEAAFQELVTEFSGHKYIANAVHAIAMRYRELQKYKKAAEFYQYVIDNWPATDIAVWSQGGVAKSNIALGNEVAAQAAIEKLLTGFSEYEDIAMNSVYDIAGEYRGLIKYDEAIKLYQYVLDNWPESKFAIESQKYIAISNILLDDRAAAQTAIDSLIADFNDHQGLPEALYGIARRYRWSRKYEEAKNIYQQIIQQYPDSSYADKAQLDVSKINVFSPIESGEDKQAETAIDKLVADFNDHSGLPEALYDVARNYELSGKYEEAKGIYQQIIQQYPDSSYADKAQLDVSKINVLSLIGSGSDTDVQTADTDVQTAIDSLIADFNDHPGLSRAVFRIGEEYYTEAFSDVSEGFDAGAGENFTKALAVWERIITELPESTAAVEAYYFSAVCYRKLGQYEKAIEYYQKVVTDWPDYQYAWSAQCLIGNCYERLRNSGSLPESEANRLIEQAYQAVLENYPDCPLAKHASLKLGQMNFERGQWVEAVVYFELFLETADLDDPRTIEVKARLKELEGVNE